MPDRIRKIDSDAVGGGVDKLNGELAGRCITHTHLVQCSREMLRVVFRQTGMTHKTAFVYQRLNGFDDGKRQTVSHPTVVQNKRIDFHEDGMVLIDFSCEMARLPSKMSCHLFSNYRNEHRPTSRFEILFQSIGFSLVAVAAKERYFKNAFRNAAMAFCLSTQ